MIGRPSMRMRLRPAIGGPSSMTCPTPLKTRPSSPGPSAKCRVSPRKRTRTSLSARPLGRLEHLDHQCSLVDRGNAAEPRSPSCPRISTASFRPTSSVRAETAVGLRSRSPRLHRELRPHGASPCLVRPSQLPALCAAAQPGPAHPRRSPRPCAAARATRQARRSPVAKRPLSSAVSARSMKRRMSLQHRRLPRRRANAVDS